MSRKEDWTLLPIETFNSKTRQWDNLNKTTANSLLLKSEFVTTLLEHFGTGKEILAIYGNIESPLAMTIIHSIGTGRWQVFQPSQAPIGCWLQYEKIETAALCNSLSSALPGLTLALSIPQQDPSCLKRPVSKGKVSTLDYIETARINVDSSFDDYWKFRSKNLRQGLKRQRNRLNREDVTTTLLEISDPSQISDAIAEYGELESASWKSDSGTAISANNAQGRFYTDLLEKFCANGLGVIYQYKYNDKLAATDLCIRDKDTIIILKTTYDEKITTSSPAMLMRQEVFEKIFTEKLHRRIEFYGKVMDWHRKWSDDIRVMFHINCYSTPVRALKLASKLF